MNIILGDGRLLSVRGGWVCLGGGSGHFAGGGGGLIFKILIGKPKAVNIYSTNTTEDKVSMWWTSARFVAKNKNLRSFYSNWVGGHFHKK